MTTQVVARITEKLFGKPNRKVLWDAKRSLQKPKAIGLGNFGSFFGKFRFSERLKEKPYQAGAR